MGESFRSYRYPRCCTCRVVKVKVIMSFDTNLPLLLPLPLFTHTAATAISCYRLYYRCPCPCPCPHHYHHHYHHHHHYHYPRSDLIEDLLQVHVLQPHRFSATEFYNQAQDVVDGKFTALFEEHEHMWFIELMQGWLDYKTFVQQMCACALARR